jgi:hypothetical protein
MMNATCGLTSPKQFAEYDPVTRSLRTYPGIGLWGSIEFSGTLPRHGMTCGGAVLELLMSEHPTAGSGYSSLLVTPTAQLAVNGGAQHPDKRKDGGHGPTLADQVEFLLPTPLAHMNGASQREIDEGNPRSRLETEVALLPTPRATDGTKGGPNQRGSSGDLMLPSAVQLLPTPRAARGASGTETMYELGAVRSDEGRPQGEVLLPTPTVMDYKASGGSTTSDVTLTDAIVRTQLGAHTNLRFDGGNEPSDDAAPHLLSGTLEAGNG